MNVLQVSLTDISAFRHTLTLNSPISEFTTKKNIPFHSEFLLLFWLHPTNLLISRYYMLDTVPLFVYVESEVFLS